MLLKQNITSEIQSERVQFSLIVPSTTFSLLRKSLSQFPIKVHRKVPSMHPEISKI